MTLLDRYLVGRLISTYLKVLISLLAFFVVIDLTTHLRSTVVERDVPAVVVAEYYAAIMPSILTGFKFSPLALLISGLLVFGRFVQQGEYGAVLAGGVGLRRILVGPIVFATLISGVMFFVSNGIGPSAAERVIDIENYYFGKAQRDGKRERTGIFLPNLEDGWKCDVRKFNRYALTGEGVFLYAIHDGRHEQIQARRIYWDEDVSRWYLEDGTWSVFDEENDNRAQTESFARMGAPFGATPDFLLTAEVDTATLSIGRLAELRKKHSNQGYTARRLGVDFHTKIVDPLLCILFVTLAVPFSVRLGRGGVALGLSMAILLGLGYMVLAAVAQGMGYSGQIPVILGAWLAFGVYFLGCSGLIYRTPT